MIQLPPRAAVIVAPLKPVALGVAIGIFAGALVAAVTAAHLVVLPREAWHLELLAQYFRGYSVSPLGVVVGAGWGGLAGFVAGWLLAFARNAAVRLWLGFVQTKANLEKSDFLDGI